MRDRDECPKCPHGILYIEKDGDLYCSNPDCTFTFSLKDVIIQLDNKNVRKEKGTN